MEKVRLDVLLVSRGLQESRQKAQATIMSGQVYVDGRRVDKPGTAVPASADIEVRGGLRYVSRGGLKLEKAMALWPISLEGKVCMDVGASTGGFTDCMLQNGAAKVYAIRGCELYLSAPDPAGHRRRPQAGGHGGLPHQAPV